MKLLLEKAENCESSSIIMNSSMTPEKFVDLQDYFYIQPLFFGLPPLEPEDIAFEWEKFYNHVQQHVGYLVNDNDETLRINLTWLRGPMWLYQKEDLRKTILDSLNQLKGEREGEVGNLSRSRLKKMVDNYPLHYPRYQKDKVYQYYSSIDLYLNLAALRLEEALEVINNNQGIIDISLSEIHKPTRKQIPTYNSFEELFKEQAPENIEKCVKALRDYRPEKPIIGDERNWIGGKKDIGIVVTWIERMEEIGKIRRVGDRKYLVKLLKAFFSDLVMGADASVFDKVRSRDMKDRFKVLLYE